MYINLKPNKHKIISFNTTTMAPLGFIIAGPPPPPLIKRGGEGGGRGRSIQKLSHLGGTKNFARKRG